MAQDAHQQVAVGDHAVDARAGQGAGQRPGGLVAGRARSDHLGEQRVVVDADDRAGDDAGVEAESRRRRVGELGDRRRGRRSVCSVPLCGCQPAAGSSA